MDAAARERADAFMTRFADSALETAVEPVRKPHSAWYQGLRGYDCHTCGAFSATIEGTFEIERDCAKQCQSVLNRRAE